MTLNINDKITQAKPLDGSDATTATVEIGGMTLQVVVSGDGQIALVHRQASGVLDVAVVSQEQTSEIDADVLTALVRLGREKGK